MKCLSKKGFTLVELMVVIAIIGLLSVALTSVVSKVQSLARAAKCKANLKGLTQAAYNFGIHDNNYKYPSAGSFEYFWAGETGSKDIIYHAQRGWVTWTKGDSTAWPWDSEKEHHSEMSPSTYHSPQGQRAYISVTNGELWRLVGKDASMYVCEAHKRIVGEKGKIPKKDKVYRSYVMSGYFNYHNKDGRKVQTNDGRVSIDSAVGDGRASIRLMFAELPAHDERTEDQYKDSVLEYKMIEKEPNDYKNEKQESIGFNHFIAKRWVGHVAFADGHVEGLVLPNTVKWTSKDIQYNGGGKQDLWDLAGQLCDAQEIKDTLREKMH